MKLYSKLFFIAFWAFLLVACSSKEEEMSRIIKCYISETLQNPDSYQSVETTIDSLRNDRYGDTLIFDNVLKDIDARKSFYNAQKGFSEKRDIIREALASAKISEEEMSAIEIERGKLDEYLKEMNSQANIMKSLETEIKAYEKKCDGKFYGWLVTHKFNYLSKDEEQSSCTYVFFMDKECKTIFRSLDEDKTPYDAYKKYIDMIIKGEM